MPKESKDGKAGSGTKKSNSGENSAAAAGAAAGAAEVSLENLHEARKQANKNIAELEEKFRKGRPMQTTGTSERLRHLIGPLLGAHVSQAKGLIVSFIDAVESLTLAPWAIGLPHPNMPAPSNEDLGPRMLNALKAAENLPFDNRILRAHFEEAEVNPDEGIKHFLSEGRKRVRRVLTQAEAREMVDKYMLSAKELTDKLVEESVKDLVYQNDDASAAVVNPLIEVVLARIKEHAEKYFGGSNTESNNNAAGGAAAGSKSGGRRKKTRRSRHKKQVTAKYRK
jgi:hypothetical protein